MPDHPIGDPPFICTCYYECEGRTDDTDCPEHGRRDEPEPCRAKRWNGTPAFDGPHEWHFFTYGPNGIYTGSCRGR